MATDVTNTTAAVHLRQVWDEGVQGYHKRALRLHNQVTDFSAMAQSTGANQINIPLVMEETAASLSTGTQITFAAQTDEDAALTFTRYVEPKRIDDLSNIQSNSALFNLYAESIGYALAKVTEAGIATAIQAGATAVELAGTQAITEAELQTALVAGIDAGITPGITEGCLYVAPLLYSKVLLLDVFNEFQYTGTPGGYSTGAAGDVYGFKVFASTDWADAGVTNEVSATFFTKNSTASAFQVLPHTYTRDPHDYIGTALIGQVVHGAISLTDTNTSAGWIYVYDSP